MELLREMQAFWRSYNESQSYCCHFCWLESFHVDFLLLLLQQLAPLRLSSRRTHSTGNPPFTASHKWSLERTLLFLQIFLQRRYYTLGFGSANVFNAKGRTKPWVDKLYESSSQQNHSFSATNREIRFIFFLYYVSRREIKDRAIIRNCLDDYAKLICTTNTIRQDGGIGRQFRRVYRIDDGS